MSLIIRRALALVVVVAFVAASGRTAVLAQDDDTGPAGRPPIGAAVSYFSEEGNEIGLVTITEVVDPYTDSNETSPPDAGFRFIEVGLEVEATGRRPLEFYPYYIYVQDRDGFLYGQAFLFRDSALTEERPDYTSDTVASGDTAAGYLYFSVFEDAEIVRVIYTDFSSRLIFLADLTAEGSVVTPGGSSVGDDSAETEDTEDTEDTQDNGDTEDAGDTGDSGLVISAEDCEDVAAWYQETEDRVAELEGTFGTTGSDNPDPDTARDMADELEALAEQQADSDVPEVARDANDLLVQYLEELATGLDAYADAVEDGADPETELINVFTGVEATGAAGTELIDGLVAGCDL